MHNYTIDQSLEFLRSNFGPHEFHGLSNSAIQEIEQLFESPLPDDLMKFMAFAGHDWGPLFKGSSVSFSPSENLKDDCVELLQETSNAPKLPTTAFPFLFHQGYQFMFVSIADGAVYMYSEGDTEFSRQYPSFAALVGCQIRCSTR